MEVKVTCFLFLVHAIASSSSAPQFSFAVFPGGKLYAGPFPPHYVFPPTATHGQHHVHYSNEEIHVHANKILLSFHCVLQALTLKNN